MVATRHARGEVRSPERLLRKMVELHGRGELRLDKSLFGLMDRRASRAGAGRRGRRAAPAGGGGDDPPPSPKPPLTRPSRAWMAEQEAKQAAYERQRRRHTEAWFRRLQGLADEPEPEQAPDAGPAAPADSPSRTGKQSRPSRAHGVIHDLRQGKLGLDG